MIAPLLASLIVFNCPAVGSSVIITVPVCVVTVPAKAAAKSDAVPNNESLVTFKVISPEIASLIVFNCVTFTLPVMVTSPLYILIVSASVDTKLAAVPDKEPSVLSTC